MALLRKFTMMAALGALGAAIGAGLGEGLFSRAAAQRSEPRRICLLFDVSGSMAETVRREDGGSITQLQALKDAACDFIARQDLARDLMGLVVFSSDAHLVASLSHDAELLQKSIRGLWASGGTNLGRGLDVTQTVLAHEPGERWVLVFTDGKPETSSTGESPQVAALSAASRLRGAGVKIVAIGTPLADAGLLAQAAGGPANVIVSDASRLHEAFERSEEVINRQMLASTGASGFTHNALLAGAWAALVAIGAGFGLVVAQNRHLRRRALGLREGFMVVVGGAFTGLAAGFAGQSVFFVLSGVSAVAAIGRVAAWGLLGAGLGYGMGSFVPNLARRRAAFAVAAAGAAAALSFLTLVPLVGDAFGRLLGAAVLGLAAGLMTVIIEAACREAWLVVHWGPRERTTLTLGEEPILVGASAEAHVLLAEDDSPSPIMARISLSGGAVGMEDHAGRSSVLRHGETIEFGRIRIEVCASGAPAPEPAPERTERRATPQDPAARARARESSRRGAEGAPRER
jgi:Ca-activated chloride channel family protein